MADEKLFHVGVKGLIKNKEGKILLLRLSKSHAPKTGVRKEREFWDIPGGRIQAGGNIEETLAREIQEETGITDLQDIEHHTSVLSNIELPISETEKVGLVLMVYNVTVPEDSSIELSEENDHFEWVDALVAAERLAFKYPKAFVDSLLAK
jgi:8-oxo-dGTP pyrophosphatase MutT (NUDIX family)